MNDPIVVTRSLVKRGWSDFEPKVIAGLLSGSAGAFLIPIAAQFGIHLSPMQANYVVVGAYFLGSYFTPSAGTTITQTRDTRTLDGPRHVESETHSGNAVTTVTASTPVQAPVEPEPAVSAKPEPTVAAPSSFAEARWGASPPSGPIPLHGDAGATEVYR